MKLSYIKGIGFGLTSGVITTLGMMVGLYSGTNSRLAVIGGIITVAVADAFSDALGIHISEESTNLTSYKEVWEATFATFFSKFIFALTFVVPVLTLSLEIAVITSIIWGFFLLGLISFFIAKSQKEPVWKVVGEHWLIGFLVILITYYLGIWIASTFGALN